MSYYREARVDELTEWLDMNFGHNDKVDVSAEVLARALIAKFDILFASNTPT